MGLIDDLKKWYEDAKYPPDGADLDYGQNTETKQIYRDSTGGYARWGDPILVVYRRGEELVGVYDVEPATEMQDWGDYGDPEIVPVEAYEVTITQYRKVDA